MRTLPIELMTEILLRLPAKALLRCKVVCKLWYNLIRDDASFVSLHLERSIASKTNLHFVVASPKLHLADFDTFENTVALRYPFKRSGVEVVGSCNGLLCLFYHPYGFLKPLLLYNPTTQSHKLLPVLPIPEFTSMRPRGDSYFGFGFDSASRDYKCVRIVQNSLVFEMADCRCQVMVYSLKSDTWRKGPDLPHFFVNDGGNGVLLHETVHWVGFGVLNNTNRPPQPIVAFNFQNETFRSLALPDFEAERIFCLDTGVLDGCLCLLSICCLDECHVWVMKEYGVAGSWEKLFTFIHHHYSIHFDRIVSYSRSGNGLFFRTMSVNVVYLDLETMEITSVSTADFVRCTDAYLCVENLLVFDHADYGLLRKNNDRNRKRKHMLLDEMVLAPS